MDEKSPETYGMITYFWVVLLAMWGGVTNYLGRVKTGHIERFSIIELVGEMSISAFSGVMAFYICEWFNLPSVATAAIVGVAGHMGGRTLYLIEQAGKRHLGIGQDPNKK